MLIAWIHSIAELSSPTCSPFVTVVAEGLCGSLARPIIKKTLFNTEMLATMVNDTHKNGTIQCSSVNCVPITICRFSET